MAETPKFILKVDIDGFKKLALCRLMYSLHSESILYFHRVTTEKDTPELYDYVLERRPFPRSSLVAVIRVKRPART